MGVGGHLMKGASIILFCLGFISISLGQLTTITQIEDEVREIEELKNIDIKEFDVNKFYDRIFDGGGIIKVFLRNEEIVKIEEKIGLSYGRITTIIYLKNDIPIQIVDREENFKFKEDQTSLDYSTLNQVFEATVYIFDWDYDKSEIVTTGERNLSEGTCSTFEYEPLIDNVRKILK